MAEKTNKNKSRKRPLESEDDEDTPSTKRHRMESHHNRNHNHNHNRSGSTHEHYQKWSNRINRINPYQPSFLGDSDDDVTILHSNIPTSLPHQREIKKLKMDIRELKEKLRILRNIAVSRMSPDYHLSLNKKNGMIASLRIALLKKKKMRIYNEKTINVKVTNASHKKYTKSIKAFLKRNKNCINHTNNAKNPEIAYNHNVWKRQRECLELTDENEYGDGICAAEDIDELMLNTHLVASTDIGKNTVIGEYMGLQVTINEMEDIYHRSTDRGLANLFAFELFIDLEDIENVDSDMDDEETDEEEDKEDGEGIEAVIEEIKTTGSKFVVDAIGYERISKCDHLLMYVTPVGSSTNHTNVEYVYTNVNGWPRIFVVTKRDIEKDSILCGFYGPTFKMAEYQRLRDKRNRARIGVYIDRILKMPLFMTDREDRIV